MQDPNEFLMGGGGKSASFKILGAMVSGTVTRTPEVRQQTDAKDKSLKTFKDGSPMMQLVIVVQTTERVDAEDDGVRSVYAKSGMLTAIRDAVKAAGAKGLEVGGELTIQYVGDGEKTSNLDPPKVYAARYVPPVAAGNGFLMGTQPAQPVAQAAPQYAPGFAPQQPFPAAQPVAQAAPLGPPAAMLPPLPPLPAAPVVQALPCPQGVDPAAWAALPVERQQQYLVQLGQPVG